ncbi:MAG TPA: hypothetical protein PLW86_19905 [Rhodocyclaceae bacterium]|nr:hypothetical protein [Rhodocyclaceae bacterium]
MVILLIIGCDWPTDVDANWATSKGRPRKAEDYIRKNLFTAT